VASVGLGVAFYRGALRLDLSKFFTVTSVLVIAFAAYLIFGGVHELGEATGSEVLDLIAPLGALLYGAGLRVLECCRLRVQDVDFATNQIVVRGGKGDKDR